MQYDVIIVGGGMVGLTLACALPTKYRVALIDAAPQAALNDARLIALTHGSCCLYQNLGLWPALASHASPIKQIHVSHRGHFGITRIHANNLNLNNLGNLVPAKYINAALEEKIQSLQNVEIIRPATLKNITQSHDENNKFTTLSIQTSTEIIHLTAHTIIGADGTHSTVRELLNIPTKIVDYDQSAIVTITELSRDHKNIAYERFQQEGAIAMLPLTGQRAATIWTDKNNNIAHLMQLSDEQFQENLQQAFGYRLGRFQKTHARQTYPLKLVVAEEQQKQNIILIGNAAHTLHPIASQGLNLALYEIAELIEHLENKTPWRDTQQKISAQLSHHLSKLFSTDFFIVNIARQAGMLGFDICPSIKEFFMRKAMGRTGRIPNLLLEREAHEFQNRGH